MNDMLDKGLAWLETQRVKHLSRNVRYHRGTDAVDVPATLGMTEFEVDSGDGVLLQVESRDYLVAVADLVLSGGAVLPQVGDWIEDAGIRYDVAAPGNEPCWRYSDGYNRVLRIHTKRG